MKRSEALQLIREKLMGQQMLPNYEEQILDVIEEIGMLPPIFIMWPDVEACEFNEWEPEDER